MVIGVGSILTIGALTVTSNIVAEKKGVLSLYNELGLTSEDYMNVLNRSIEADYGHYSFLLFSGLFLASCILIAFIYNNSSRYSERKNIEDFTQRKSFLLFFTLYSIHQYFLISFIDSFFYLYLENMVYALTACSVLFGCVYVFLKKCINLYQMVKNLEKKRTLSNPYMEYKLYMIMKSNFIKDSVKLKLLKKHINNVNYYGKAPFLLLKSDCFYFDDSVLKYNNLKEKEFKKSDAFDDLIKDGFYSDFIIQDKDFFEEFNKAYQRDSDFNRMINNGIALDIDLRDYYLSNFKLRGGYEYLYKYDQGLLTIEEQCEKNRREWVIIND